MARDDSEAAAGTAGEELLRMSSKVAPTPPFGGQPPFGVGKAHGDFARASLVFVAVTRLPRPWEEGFGKAAVGAFVTRDRRLFSLSESFSAPLASGTSVHPLVHSIPRSLPHTRLLQAP